MLEKTDFRNLFVPALSKKSRRVSSPALIDVKFPGSMYQKTRGDFFQISKIRCQISRTSPG